MATIPLFLVTGGSGPLATDAFTRADAADLGANWTVCKGAAESLQIISNQAAMISAGGARGGNYYSAVTAPNDQYSQALIVAIPANALGVSVRNITSGTTRNAYFAGFDANDFGPGSRIWKQVGSVSTSLATGATTLAGGQTWRLEVVGTNLTFKINGATECTVSDPDLASGQFGLWGESTVINFVAFDNWEGGIP